MKGRNGEGPGQTRGPNPTRRTIAFSSWPNDSRVATTCQATDGATDGERITDDVPTEKNYLRHDGRRKHRLEKIFGSGGLHGSAKKHRKQTPASRLAYGEPTDTRKLRLPTGCRRKLRRGNGTVSETPQHRRGYRTREGCRMTPCQRRARILKVTL